MHPKPTHLPIPLYPLSAFVMSSQKKTKKLKEKFALEAVVCHGVSHSVTFYPNSFTSNAHCNGH